MKYYKKNIPSKWQVFAFESDGSQDSHIENDMVAITEDEAKAIASTPPVDSLALDLIRNASTKRNWSWPPKAYQEAIGQIAVSSSSIEVLIRTVIWHISGLDSNTGRAFTGKMRISELTEILKALVELRAPQLKSEVTEICAAIKAAFDKRAVYVHQVWTVKDGLPAVGKLFLERYERLETLTVVSLEDMYSLADNMNSIQTRLMSNVLMPLLPAQPK
ncbi:hypothetical protein [Sideroxydans lithotrophicus]|uniref:Uncharacterized protein n=1 Tax=Sideroxydans lithotrophicus (strain ES-1) TaxID=580332 RepID=D5CRN3_SIDLE|nr:hypothetical protein [Sideroxydans lithotrophicus]ADE11619.1 hypothetical protein Slit_1382 [Sideroxydans lithotrophicus ES-1]